MFGGVPLRGSSPDAGTPAGAPVGAERGGSGFAGWNNMVVALRPWKLAGMGEGLEPLPQGAAGSVPSRKILRIAMNFLAVIADSCLGYCVCALQAE